MSDLIPVLKAARNYLMAVAILAAWSSGPLYGQAWPSGPGLPAGPPSSLIWPSNSPQRQPPVVTPSAPVHFPGDILFPTAPVIVPRRGPGIPEPLYFDLIRPLDVRKGEGEFNLVGAVPFRRERGNPRVEWVPELEYAVADGLALEFTTPFSDGTLKAYSIGGQYTIGTAFEDRFIHGVQGNVLYDRERRGTMLSLLYIWGIRFSETTSMMVMLGARTEYVNNTIARKVGYLVDPVDLIPEASTIGSQGGNRTETLLNLTLFEEITDQVTLGFETNYARGLEGESTLLLLPQVQWAFRPNWLFVGGVGTQSVSGSLIPFGVLGFVREW